MTHDEIAELLGAYALDAVTPEEALEIEQHLAECPRCRAEVAAHREVAGVLGNISTTAPPGLWDRIAEELSIGSTGPLGSASRPASPPPPVLGEIGAVSATAGGNDNGEDDEEPATPAPVIAIGSARALRSVSSANGRPPDRQRRRGYAVVGVAASVVVILAIVIGVLSTKVGDLNNQVSALNSAILSGGVSAQAVAAENAPHHVTLDLTSATAAWSAKVVALPNGEAWLVPGKMPALASDRTFQAWALVGGKFVSLGVIGPSGAEMQLQPTMTAILVNTEPEGGTAQPTTTPFISGNLPKVL